jgi:hypothetical protein
MNMKGRITIENVSMPTANMEYSFALPAGTRKFTLKLREVGQDLKACFTTGFTTVYRTISSGNSWTENNIKGGSNTLYFKAAAANQTAEILYAL